MVGWLGGRERRGWLTGTEGGRPVVVVELVVTGAMGKGEGGGKEGRCWRVGTDTWGVVREVVRGVGGS